MYESLKANSGNFHLYIFAFDDLTFEILNDLKLACVTTISLQNFETEELKEVKKTRSKAEYCWTCTPSTISYAIDRFSLPHCTYVDSDLLFYSDPAVLVDEMNLNDKTVLITEHRFSFLPGLYEAKRGGRFCVQFVTFTNEMQSLRVLDKWRLQCIDWCYARYENGRFGDQKYLDEWPVLYDNVHILNHQGGGVAPWNLGQYIFNQDGKLISVTRRMNKLKFDVVFFHFQYVKFLDERKVDIGWYLTPSKVVKIFYLPYLCKVSKIEDMLRKSFQGYNRGFTKFKADNFKNLLKIGFKKMSGYNIIKFI
jgi:hypothetical protein